MDHERAIAIFEKFFEKYKKTEGDRTAWSAFWIDTMPTGAEIEINLTKCPRGTVFKVFRKGKKLGEIIGWDDFFAQIETMLGPDWDLDAFFSSMEIMI